MKIGVPREIKDHENRVAMTPAGVHLLVEGRHEVCVEKDAGLGSGIEDREYAEVGAKIVQAHADAFDSADPYTRPPSCNRRRIS